MNKSTKQKEIYEFIKNEISNKGYPPSVREICSAVGLSSTATVHGHLERLEKKGLIKRDPAKPRTIEVIENSLNRREMINVPIIGTITAGLPILAIENIEDTFPLPVSYVKSTKDLFIVRVTDECMIDIGILNGDFAIIKKTSSVKNGEIVLTLIENKLTIKRFFKEKSFIKFKPENKNMKPIIVPNCEIVGKVIGVYRQFP